MMNILKGSLSQLYGQIMAYYHNESTPFHEIGNISNWLLLGDTMYHSSVVEQISDQNPDGFSSGIESLNHVKRDGIIRVIVLRYQYYCVANIIVDIASFALFFTNFQVHLIFCQGDGHYLVILIIYVGSIIYDVDIIIRYAPIIQVLLRKSQHRMIIDEFNKSVDVAVGNVLVCFTLQPNYFFHPVVSTEQILSVCFLQARISIVVKS